MKLRRVLTLALLAGVCLSPLGLRAQEPHGAPPPAQHEAPAPHEPSHEAAQPHAAPASHEAQVPGHGASHEGHGPKPKDVILKFVNFGIFFGLLFFLLKGALSAAFKARAQELKDQLSQSERDRAEAEAQVRELEARMGGLEAELAGIMAKAEAEAEVEKQRILDAARAEAAQIQAQTRQDIEHQRSLAQQELRALVAELAVQGATQRLQAQLQGATAAPVLDRAIQQIGGAQ